MEISEAKIRVLASMVHEANRAFCKGIGDHSLVPWEETAKDIQESAIEGVRAILDNPHMSSKDSHEQWLLGKVNDGYVYGPEKDDEKKTHPCLVDYELLPVVQRYKDKLFRYIVRSYVDFRTDEESRKKKKDD